MFCFISGTKVKEKKRWYQYKFIQKRNLAFVVRLFHDTPAFYFTRFIKTIRIGLQQTFLSLRDIKY